MSYSSLFRFPVPSRARRRHKRKSSRPLRCEVLESRRLLVAEGDLFAFSNTFDASGLLGDVSSTIRWGDGVTTSASSVISGNETGNLSIRFDYSLDTNHFFGGANESRRDLLQIAADSLTNRFSDDLAAITPTDLHQWQVSVFHPSMGELNRLEGSITPLAANLPVAENEIVIYVGARDLPGNTRGVGGSAANSVTSLSSVDCPTQAECDAILADFEAFQDIVKGRGEPGALASPPTDFAPHIGSISFDNNTDFYFDQPGSIQPEQIDFISVATHELAHTLGFGTSDSWDRLVHSGVYTGSQANAAYLGDGNVPIVPDHWAQSVLDAQPALMAPSLSLGTQQLFSPLDFAAMDDIGWDLISAQVTVTGEHRYVDDGTFDPEVVLTGETAGELVLPLNSVSVTNVQPTLAVPNTQNVDVGDVLSITDIGLVTDPGSRNTSVDPATTETFTYQIAWGDGSSPDQGTATIDAHGDRDGALTVSSFDGSHIYQTPGTRQITVSVSDDDGATSEKTFAVVVTGSPVPTIQLVASPTGPGGAPDPADLPGGPQPTSWADQRSDLREIVITLITPIASVSADDLVLTNLGINASLDSDVIVPLEDAQLSLSADGKQLTISFAAGELTDGVYQLQLLSAITGGDPVTITGDDLNKFFVLTGDWNGSGAVNIQDFATFAYWFASNQSPQYVDLNDSGGVNIQDFADFAKNFGVSVGFSQGGAPLKSGLIAEGESESLSRTTSNRQPVDVGEPPASSPDAFSLPNEVVMTTPPTKLEFEFRVETQEPLRASSPQFRKTAPVNVLSGRSSEIGAWDADLSHSRSPSDAGQVEQKTAAIDVVIRMLSHDRRR